MYFLKTTIIIWILTSLYFSSYSIDQDNQNIQKLFRDFQSTSSAETKSEIVGKLAEEIKLLSFSEAIQQWDKFDSICTKISFEKGNGYCHLAKAVLYCNNGSFKESYNALEKSLEYYSSADDKYGMACVLSNYGDLYSRLNDYPVSIDYYKKSAELFSDLKDTVNEAYLNLNIGAIYSETGQPENAKKYLRTAINVFKQSNYTHELIPCYLNLGEIYHKENKIDSALWYFNWCLNYSQGSTTVSDLIYSNYFPGRLYMNNGQLELAVPLLSKVDELISEHPNDIPVNELAQMIDLLGKFYEMSGDNKKALLYSNKAKELEVENKINKASLEINRLKIEQSKKEVRYEINRRLWTTYISIAGFLGSVLLFFAFYRSYKHKKEANRLLTEMDEVKTRLYSNISHELRTPLTLILSPLEQMLSDESNKIPTHKQVKMMRKNANSVLNLVNQLLDLSKIDAKNMKLELVEDDINKFLRIHFAAFASLAGQKSISYHCSLLHEKNIIIFDSSKLEKIINNLLSNAIKFTTKNGEVACYANFPQDEKLELIVQDNGKGIPANELNQIFNRYYQVKTNDETISLGTGIGLSLTKELVELMHGKIEVESTVGEGTKFTVTVPLGTKHLNSDEYRMISNLSSKSNEVNDISDRMEKEQESTETAKISENKENLPHVLVVEDNADIRDYIAENLSDGFIVETAGNGKAGLKRAFKNIPDLVITDIVMPKMDGIELCKNLKTDEKTSHIPVVMLTGKSGFDDRLQGIETGADAYLIKPFNIKELHLQVTKLIEQRQKLRERFTRDLRLEPKDIAVTSADEKFITRAMEIIEKNIGNSEFEVSQFQDEMFMSRMQLFRKIKALTNQTPGDFIRTVRLKRAASLIKQNFGNIAQITYEVGFNNPSYFAKCFKDLYGVLPSDFIKNQNHNSEEKS